MLILGRTGNRLLRALLADFRWLYRDAGVIGVKGVAGVAGDLKTAFGYEIGTGIALPSEKVEDMSEAAKVSAESFDMTENTR